MALGRLRLHEGVARRPLAEGKIAYGRDAVLVGCRMARYSALGDLHRTRRGDDVFHGDDVELGVREGLAVVGAGFADRRGAGRRLVVQGDRRHRIGLPVFPRYLEGDFLFADEVWGNGSHLAQAVGAGLQWFGKRHRSGLIGGECIDDLAIRVRGPHFDDLVLGVDDLEREALEGDDGPIRPVAFDDLQVRFEPAVVDDVVQRRGVRHLLGRDGPIINPSVAIGYGRCDFSHGVAVSVVGKRAARPVRPRSGPEPATLARCEAVFSGRDGSDDLARGAGDDLEGDSLCGRFELRPLSSIGLELRYLDIERDGRLSEVVLGDERDLLAGGDIGCIDAIRAHGRVDEVSLGGLRLDDADLSVGNVLDA